mmetsp:Transcript_100306/g.214939  ORF Transcript_100306/g.214939 Transcript_100306/m.214939 type:complete len:657 (+) Transcript_100306:74-2044(+)
MPKRSSCLPSRYHILPPAQESSALVKVTASRAAQAPRTILKDAEAPVERLEETFMANLQGGEAYLRIMRDLCADTGLRQREVEEHLTPLCLACWSECESIMVGKTGSNDSVLLGAAWVEVKRLQQQLSACNLAALKQVESMRTSIQRQDSAFGVDTLTFYDPLQYCDAVTKELVLNIVVEKLQALERGGATDSFLQSLLDRMGEGDKKPKKVKSGDDDDDRDALLDRLESAEMRCERAEARLRMMEEKGLASEQRAREAAAQLLEAQSQCDKLQAQAADQAEALERALGARRDLEARHAANEAALARLEAEIAAEREKAAEQAEKAAAGDALAMQRTEAKLAAAVEGAERARRQAQEAEEKRRQLEAREAQLEKEMAELRAKLRTAGSRGNNVTRSQDAQTDLTGDALDTLNDENRKLKLALDELTAKFGDMMEEFKKQGVDTGAAETIAKRVGLRPLLKGVFQRLYEDALQRFDRLEVLRQKLINERPQPLTLWKEDMLREYGHSEAALQALHEAGVSGGLAAQLAVLSELHPAPPVHTATRPGIPASARPRKVVICNPLGGSNAGRGTSPTAEAQTLTRSQSTPLPLPAASSTGLFATAPNVAAPGSPSAKARGGVAKGMAAALATEEAAILAGIISPAAGAAGGRAVGGMWRV